MTGPVSDAADVPIREPLSERFTSTRRARRGEAFEMLATPADLRDWCTAEADVPCREATAAQPDEALALREAVYRWAVAASEGGPGSEQDRRTINDWAVRDTTARILTEQGARRVLPARPEVATALALVAASAVDLLGGSAPGAIKICAADDCGRVFLDTSRGRTRRWCSMSVCGNRAKKAGLRARADSRPNAV